LRYDWVAGEGINHIIAWETESITRFIERYKVVEMNITTIT